MQFHSYGFLFFFPLVLLCVWVFPRRMKNGLLLVASYLFYASWGLKYCLVLLGAAALAYLAGLLHDLGKCKEEFRQYLEAAARGDEAIRGSVNHTFAAVRYILEHYR